MGTGPEDMIEYYIGTKISNNPRIICINSAQLELNQFMAFKKPCIQ
jgi:hypothetical protein